MKIDPHYVAAMREYPYRAGTMEVALKTDRELLVRALGILRRCEEYGYLKRHAYPVATHKC
jgi:hypothetical protein